ncbi:rhomboid family intramembrane serine protease [Halodesulfurarchaeum formicicum]|uniref:rhomboid family intramembrane serine protease n=1 Tax=Halodesulfurarchaeum formicicum TaxID=1873524 RepID=UPI0009037EFB|nr:rhomboid family intramembrane serine protease [Halodesulfurarchaeum formicicum]
MSSAERASEISFGWSDVAIDFSILLALPLAILGLQYSAIIPTKWIVLDLSSPSVIAIYGRLFGHISAAHLWANVGWLLVASLSLYGFALWTVDVQLYRTVMVAGMLGTPIVTASGLWLIYSILGDLPVIAGASDIPLALLGATISLYLRDIRQLLVGASRPTSFHIWYGVYLSALLGSIAISTLTIGLGPVSETGHLLGFLVGMTIGGFV